MSTPCVDIIKDKIQDVSETCRNQKDYEAIVNEFLDNILELQKITEELTIGLYELIDMLNEKSSVLTADEFMSFYGRLDLLRKRLSENYARAMKNKKLYSAVKSCFIEFRDAIRSFRETISDMHLFIVELPQDREYQQLVKELNAALD